MIAKLISFEFKYRYSQPMILIFLLMLAFQGVWYAVGTYDYHVNDATLMECTSGSLPMSRAGWHVVDNCRRDYYGRGSL